MSDETTVPQFRLLLRKHKLVEQILTLVNELLSAKGLLLRAGTAIDATLIAAPSCITKKGSARDAEMVRGDELGPHTSRKGLQWYVGMNVHIGVDATTRV